MMRAHCATIKADGTCPKNRYRFTHNITGATNSMQGDGSGFGHGRFGQGDAKRQGHKILLGCNHILGESAITA